MDSVGFNLNVECRDADGSGEGGGSNSKLGGDGFIDRSRVRILLCDNNTNSSEEVLTLLMRCSYQVTSVRSARQVIDALNAEGPDIDLILAEVDIPMAKGMKMLKYITRHKDLRRIPVIMMSAQDEVSTVVKCLRLGAADYLVKPLRTNELLNLWTHMWRRRRMLGLVEKNILFYEFDVVASDPSDANTTSTTFFSDDTDERFRRTAAVNNPEIGFSVQQEDETAFHSAGGAAFKQTPKCHPDVPGISDRLAGQICVSPKKSELRMGKCSAFFTYVKSSIARNNALPISHNETIMRNNSLPANHNQNERIVRINSLPPSHNERIVRNNSLPTSQSHSQSIMRDKSLPPGHNESSIHQSLRNKQNTQAPTEEEEEKEETVTTYDAAAVPENGEAWEKWSQGDDFPSSSSLPNLMSFERSYMSSRPADCLNQRNSFVGEKVQQQSQMPHISGFPPQSTFPYYIPGAMMPPPAQMYQQQNVHDFQNHAAASVKLPPHYNHLQHCAPHMPGMASFPYYPLGMCVPPNQVSAQPWPNSSVREMKANNVDRREVALMKFRQKRKERCFDKKIRYVNRKKLAERRPRVRGQFVRKVNGVNMDLNGHPASADYDDEDEAEDEEELASQGYSMEDDTSAY